MVSQSKEARAKSYVLNAWNAFLHPTPAILLQPHTILIGLLICLARLVVVICTVLGYISSLLFHLSTRLSSTLFRLLKELVPTIRHVPYLLRQTPDELAALARSRLESRTLERFVSIQTGTGIIQERYLGVDDQPPEK